jgi:hypothetical protein
MAWEAIVLLPFWYASLILLPTLVLNAKIDYFKLHAKYNIVEKKKNP